MTTIIQLKRPIDGVTLSIIREISIAAAMLGHRALLVGATARIILIEHVFGLAPGRATRDIDFAFAMENWAQFEALKQHLIGKHGLQADAHAVHRLYFPIQGTTHRMQIDLVPYGALGGPAAELRWPPDKAIIMNIAGFADAAASAVQVELSTDVTIDIASLPGLAILKLLAWANRKNETHNDASDLTTLLRNYHEAQGDRVYSLPADTFAELGYDIELGGAWLLGNDVRHIAHTPTAEKLTRMVESTDVIKGLARDMARGLNNKIDPDGHATSLLAQFIAGFRHE
jgi:predicted nucleotidyltransferase